MIALREKASRETEKLRDAIARSVGDFSRYRVEKPRSLLEEWGGNLNHEIGKTAGIALRQMAIGATDDAELRSLLRRVVREQKRILALVHCYHAGTRGTVAERPGLTEFSLRTLQRLAAGSDPYVLFGVPYATRTMPHTQPWDRISPVIDRLLRRRFTSEEDWGRTLVEVSRILTENRRIVAKLGFSSITGSHLRIRIGTGSPHVCFAYWQQLGKS